MCLAHLITPLWVSWMRQGRLTHVLSAWVGVNSANSWRTSRDTFYYTPLIIRCKVTGMFSQILLDLSMYQEPPYATLAIMGISLALATFTSYIGVRSLDLEQYKRLMIESSRARKALMDATRSGNQRSIDKAQKRQNELMQQEKLQK